MFGLSLAKLTELYQAQAERCGVPVTKKRGRTLAIDAILEGFRDLEEAQDWYNEFACRGNGFVGYYTGMGHPIGASAFRAALRAWEKAIEDRVDEYARQEADSELTGIDEN